MEADPARIIRLLAEACRVEGLFPLAPEDMALVADAYRSDGASEHDLWVAGLLSDEAHPASKCGDPFCNLRDEDWAEAPS